jgi:prepilin-type N-terminal cleavage/methylation domain-containing protein
MKNTQNTHSPLKSGLTTRQAFTLIELMIVLVIIGIVLSIVLPTLSGARTRARATATLVLLKDLGGASAQFQNSERRLPGNFSQVDMGSNANFARGFSAMQNIMLDLAGGTVNETANGATIVAVGPSAAGTVNVRIDQIGAPAEVKGVLNKGYFKPDSKNYVPQGQAGQQVGVREHWVLPSVVDSFGQPVLGWVQDDLPAANPSFATMDSSTRAKFYWNSNAAFLQATNLGNLGENQTILSLIGQGRPVANIVGSMAGLLGHRAFPIDPTAVPPQPAAPRGAIVFHSAGPDGVYLGMTDRGGKIATTPVNGGVVRYSTSNDPLDYFDDIVLTAGN